MAKQILTERDIEDMAKRGVLSVEMNDDVILTDLAYERAQRLGVKLVRPNATSPSAPVRPYLSKDPNAPPPGREPASVQTSGQPLAASRPEDLKQRVHAAVIARLGNQVDPVLLDMIIARVLADIGAK
jgi:hypothetical protein